jgi:hypothetical protein
MQARQNPFLKNRIRLQKNTIGTKAKTQICFGNKLIAGTIIFLNQSID